LSYDGQIYWDADTWMLPSVLVLNPALGATIVNYRVKELADAQASAKALSLTKVGNPGYVPWSNRDPQAYSNPDWRTALPEPHLMGDIAISLFDYYAATGDTQWLQGGAFNMISAIGDWFRTASVTNSAGQYTLDNVEGVDETARNVNDHAFTNAGMWRTMQILQQLAPIAGVPVNPAWATYQNVVIPTDANVANVTAEYTGFTTTGTYQPIQIDTLLTQYPAEYPLPAGRAVNDYVAYSAITRTNRPGFGDAGFSIIDSKLGLCSLSQQFLAATTPFMYGPFLNYWETRNIAQYPDANAFITNPALPFLTGAGAFLQTLTHGLTGYRFRTDKLEFDPVLPDAVSLPGTVAIRGLHWQGRIVDVNMTRTNTTIQLISGNAAPVQTPTGIQQLSSTTPVVIPTRAPAAAVNGTCN
jgi:trehalose/maltose hydrolase-like predicted phosphorylase